MPPRRRHNRKHSSGAPIEVSGLNVVVHVSRFWTPHVITAVLPVVATTWLAFLVFFLPRNDMEARCVEMRGLVVGSDAWLSSAVPLPHIPR